jgi:hypothetical protein
MALRRTPQKPRCGHLLINGLFKPRKKILGSEFAGEIEAVDDLRNRPVARSARAYFFSAASTTCSSSPDRTWSKKALTAACRSTGKKLSLRRSGPL